MRVAILTLWLFASNFAITRAAGTPALPRHGVLGAALIDSACCVTVKAVVPGGAAALAQIQPGDVIQSFEGAPVSSASSVAHSVRLTPAGKTVVLAISRNGSERTVSVTIGAPANETDADVQTLYESVTVQGTSRRTLLDVPKNLSGHRPAVLLIGGIGCFSVDVASSPEDGYLRITRDLARAGFVTMRLEKGGLGYSQGPRCQDIDFQDETASYGNALQALRRNAHVDPANVYLLGHSIGSIIAPRLALEQPVAGVVVAEAVGRNWFEYELQNLR